MVNTPQSTNTYYKETEKRKFATAVLTRLGAPVNEVNVSAMLRWMNQEDSRSVQEKGKRAIGIDRFNPLNTKWDSPGSVDSGGGIRAYNSFEQGVDATVKTLQSKNVDYSSVINVFKNAQGFDSLKTAVSESPWGTWGGSANTGPAGNFNVTSDIIARALLVNPEVAEVFKRYQGQQGEDAMQAIAADLRRTSWYSKFGEKAKSVILSSLSQDKATYAESQKTEIARVRKLALDIGATLTDSDIQSLANQTMLFGLDDADLKSAIVSSVKMDSNYIKGQAGTIAKDLYAGIDSYGYRVDTNSKEFKTYVSDILNGTRSTEDVIGQFRNMAAAAYPKFADRFKSGATLNDITSNAKYVIANTLEDSPMNIGNDNKFIQQYLNSGGMNNYDLSRAIKADRTSGWEYTANAQDELLGTFSKVLRMWGFEV